MSISNELGPSAFVSSPGISVRPWSTRPIQFQSKTSPSITFPAHKPGKTLIRGMPSSLTVVALPRESQLGGWLLKSVVLVQVRNTPKQFLATTWLEGIVEYGVGKEESEAIADLIVSLGEYRESLDKREANLGHSARRELDYLRRLIERLT